MDIPDTGAVFTLGKSYLIENPQSYFFVKNDPVKRVVSGCSESAVICESGRLFVWGENQWGQLGIGGGTFTKDDVGSSGATQQSTSKTSSQNNGRTAANVASGNKDIVTKPTCVKTLKGLGMKIKDIAFGMGWSVILTHTNEIFFSGRSIFEESAEVDKNFINWTVGGDKFRVSVKPFQLNKFNTFIDGDENFERLAAGDNHFVVVTSNGRLIGCGWNSEHQLGVDNEISDDYKLNPIEIKVNDSQILLFACGPQSTVVITETEQLFVAGQLKDYRFFRFTEIPFSFPQEKVNFMQISQTNEIFLITETGSVYRSNESARNNNLFWQKFYDWDEQDNGTVVKLLKGNAFFAGLTKARKLFTTFSESGHHLKTFREISKFKNLKVLDFSTGDEHILVLGIPKNSKNIPNFDATMSFGRTYSVLPKTGILGGIIDARNESDKKILSEQNFKNESISKENEEKNDQINGNEKDDEENTKADTSDIQIPVRYSEKNEEFKVSPKIETKEGIEENLKDTILNDRTHADDNNEKADESEHEKEEKAIEELKLNHLPSAPSPEESHQQGQVGPKTEEIIQNLQSTEHNSSADEKTEPKIHDNSSNNEALENEKLEIATISNTRMEEESNDVLTNEEVNDNSKLDNPATETEKSSSVDEVNSSPAATKSPLVRKTSGLLIKFDQKSLKSQKSQSSLLNRPHTPYPANGSQGGTTPQTIKRMPVIAPATMESSSNVLNNEASPNLTDSLENINESPDNSSTNRRSSLKYTDRALLSPNHINELNRKASAKAPFTLNGRHLMIENELEKDEKLTVEIERNENGEITENEIRFINNGIDVTDNVEKKFIKHNKTEFENDLLGENTTILVDPTIGAKNLIKITKENLLKTGESAINRQVTALTDDFKQEDARTTASVNSNVGKNSTQGSVDLQNMQISESEASEDNKQRAETKRKTVRGFIDDIKAKGKEISCKNFKSVRVEDESIGTQTNETAQPTQIQEHDDNDAYAEDNKTSKVCNIL